MRGKADVRRRGAYTSRITPACAGKRHSDCTGNSAHRDHPRVCGEKLSCRCPVLSRLGSPPRVRGKGAMPDGIAGHHRITPACAGKREKGLWRFCEYKDHPRVCGEKQQHSFLTYFITGSPPRVRGKASVLCNTECLSRITPACAGKRMACTTYCTQNWDHPRVCGEKWL